MLYHKGYFAHVQIDTENDYFYGWVVNAHNLSFQARSMSEFRQAFIKIVDQYLQETTIPAKGLP